MDRVQKVDVVVLGRGLAAVALAYMLVEQGRSVALLAEGPSLASGRYVGQPAEADASLVRLAAEQIERWQAAGVPGIEGEEVCWTLDYDQLLPELAGRVAAAPRCHLLLDGRVRGLSVIEGAFLGAIAEEARYDARLLVNAAEDERYAAFSRMLRQPQGQQFFPFAPTASERAALRRSVPVPDDPQLPRVEASGVRGAWQVVGAGGNPLLAVALAAQLADRLQA